MNNLELPVYSHQQTKQTLKKCTLCNKIDVLLRLPEEFQKYAAQKGYDSYFCSSCCQIINFCRG